MGTDHFRFDQWATVHFLTVISLTMAAVRLVSVAEHLGEE